MAYTAKHKYAPISARKARLVVDLVRGKTLDDALNICSFSRKRAAHFIGKVLQSAQANAREKDDVAGHLLYVEKAIVDEGPTRKKWICRARGMASPRRARSSHITVELGKLNQSEA
ncbi:MAG: 50S ribosomal protein L22 [Planctomycetota bacterium]|jgi:large subunit ribosomal protein L22